jgi:hypothetical protein
MGKVMVLNMACMHGHTYTVQCTSILQTRQPPVLVVKTTDVRPKYLVDLMDILILSDFRPKIVKC